MLKANEGRIIKTVIINSFIRIALSGSSGPPLTTVIIPIMPKATDAKINTLAAIFCMLVV